MREVAAIALLLTGSSACLPRAPEPACAVERRGLGLKVQLLDAGAAPRRSIAFVPRGAAPEVRVTTW